MASLLFAVTIILFD